MGNANDGLCSFSSSEKWLVLVLNTHNLHHGKAKEKEMSVSKPNLFPPRLFSRRTPGASKRRITLFALNGVALPRLQRLDDRDA